MSVVQRRELAVLISRSLDHFPHSECESVIIHRTKNVVTRHFRLPEPALGNEVVRVYLTKLSRALSLDDLLQ